ncbi:MAG: hypothetical protein FWC94_02460 [Bacteroidales bacterium]|nr:hypothetical protein [Bacteroidales bacterium]
MKRLLILAICLTGCLFAEAQLNNITTTNPRFYGEFKEGYVFFTDGDPINALLNYHFVLREMQFIDPQNGNLFNLSRNLEITHIEIGEDIFVPIRREGWGVVILNGTVALLEETRYFPESRRRVYGTSIAGTSPASTNLRNLSGAGLVAAGLCSAGAGIGGGAVGTSSITHSTPPTEYRVETQYWLMKNRNAYAATRRNFLRVFHEVRPQLEAFISENNIDFRNEQHLRGLTLFANSLLMQR